ncbi:MAG: DUF3795 domain-containing protein [Candidatus Coatesbacteria bacterium]|nr:DUF3795 domain-containing protein [Candidatus Coatesbacteria bacterium]
MEKMIAHCGINCAECPGFIATKNNDYDEKKKIAEEWAKAFNSDIKPDDIICDGCTSEGNHIGYCNVCEIRKCSIEHELENCAFCEDFSCKKLDDFHVLAKGARDNLELFRKQV